MTAESAFIYIGMALSLGASIYLFYSGQRQVGLLFVVGFFFQLQSMLYTSFIGHGHPEYMSECLATVQSYYRCLPLTYKISMHLGQLSFYVFALAIYIWAKNIQGRGNDT